MHTRNQRELGQEFTLVDVQIGTADTARLDLDQNVIVPQSRNRHLDNAEGLRLLIAESLHRLGNVGSHGYRMVKAISPLTTRKKEHKKQLKAQNEDGQFVRAMAMRIQNWESLRGISPFYNRYRRRDRYATSE